MSFELILTVSLFLGVAAALYSSVGHAGASGYLAIMALFSFAPVQMKPTALALNIIVACIASVQFYRAGFFSWKLFLPFAVTSVPFAYLGGRIDLNVNAYRSVVGVVLLFAAFRLFLSSVQRSPETVRAPSYWLSTFVGAGLGFLSGLTGVGGGIFLTPLLLLMKWSETKKAAAVSAMFILVNSISGLIGNWKNIDQVSGSMAFFAPAVVAGGLAGSYLGTRKFDTTTLRRVLAVVLIVAASKLIFI